MVIDDNKNTMEVSGMNLTEMTMKLSGKAFKIFSDSLYKNKIQAIVRELGCNAVDSYPAETEKRPFMVHLPTIFEPYFYIRDYGTGISPDNMFNV